MKPYPLPICSFGVFVFLFLLFFSARGQHPCASPPNYEIRTFFSILAAPDPCNSRLVVQVGRASAVNTLTCRGNCPIPNSVRYEGTSARIQVVKAPIGASFPSAYFDLYRGFNCNLSNLNWTGNLGGGYRLVHNRSYNMGTSLSRNFTISGLGEGEYFIIVRLGTNNSHSRYKSITGSVVLQRDVFVENLRVEDGTGTSVSSITAGDGVRIRLNHSFEGTGSPTYYPNVHYYLSSDCNLSSGDILLGTDGSSIGENDPSDSESLYTTINSVGNWYILAVADANNEVCETNEDNVFCRALRVDAGGGGGSEDVYLTNAAVADVILDVGDRTTASVRQHMDSNRGSDIDVYLDYGITRGSTCGNTDPSYVYIDDDRSSIGRDSYDNESDRFTVPHYPSGLAKIVFEADATKVVNESNEGNNCASVNVFINRFDEFDIENAILVGTPVLGAGMTVFFENHYLGNSEDTEWVRVGVYYSQDPVWSPATDRRIGTAFNTFDYWNTVGTHTINFTVPADIPAGNSYIICVVDDREQYTEDNESNNIYLFNVNLINPCTPSGNTVLAASPNPTTTKVIAGTGTRIRFSDLTTGGVVYNRIEFQEPSGHGTIWRSFENVSYVDAYYDTPGTYGAVLHTTDCNGVNKKTSIRFEIHENPQENRYSHELAQGKYFTTKKVGDPINVGTGDLDVISKDFSIVTQEGAIDFDRRYLSTDALDTSTPLGNGWIARFNQWLTFEDNLITVHKDDGSESYFIPYREISQEIRPFHALETDTMYQKTNGDYHLENLAGIVRVFDSTGIWLKTTFPSGYEYTASYNSSGYLQSVDFQHGRLLEFFYNGNKLERVSYANKTVYYNVDASHNLVGVTSVWGESCNYVYDSRNLLTEYYNYEGVREYQNTFNSLGQCYRQELANGYVMEVDVQNGVTYVTDFDGTYEYHQDRWLRTYKVRDPLGYETEVTYELDNLKVTSVTNPRGNTSTFVNSKLGEREQATLPNTGLHQVAYNNVHLPETIVNALNQATQISYTNARKPETITFSNSSTIRLTYDSENRVSTITTQIGLVYTCIWNNHDLVALQTPTGTVSMQYNTAGELIGITDRNTNQIDLTLDEYGDVLSLTITSATGDTYTAQARYSKNGHAIAYQNFAGDWMYLLRDSHDNVVGLVNFEGDTTHYEFDLKDRISKVTDAEGNWIEYERNRLGWVTKVRDQWGETTIGYDQNGNAISVTDALGRITTAEYGVMDELKKITFADGSTQTLDFDLLVLPNKATDEMGYTDSVYRDPDMNWSNRRIDQQNALFRTDDRMADGRLNAIHDLNGNQIRYLKDQYARDTAVLYANGTKFSTSLDAEGYVIGGSDANGLRSTVTHNGLGSISELSFSNGNLYQYEKDANDRLLRALKNGTVTNRFLRDKQGRITDYWDSSGNHYQFGYNKIGQRTSMSINGNTITYTYTKGLQTRVEDWLGNWQEITYNALKQPIRVDRSNGTYTLLGYNRRNQGVRVEHFDAGGVLLHSNILQRHPTGYVYADSGQWALKPSFKMLLEETERGVDDRVATFKGNTVVSNANGEITSLPLSGESFVYGEGSTLERYTNASGTITYESDALFNRIARTKNGVRTDYLIDPVSPLLPLVIGEKEGGTVTKYYIYGAFGLSWQIDVTSTTTQFFHYDNSGNTVLLTDDTGAVTDKYAYTIYGDDLGLSDNHVGSAEQPFQFQGQWGLMREGTEDLVWCRRRYYKPSFGQFLSKDKLPPNLSSPQTINRFTYSRGNPIDRMDITGLSDQTKKFCHWSPGATDPIMIMTNPSTQIIASNSFGGGGGGSWGDSDEPEPTKLEEVGIIIWNGVTYIGGKAKDATFFVVDGVGGTKDFIVTYSEMKDANWKNSDKYFHSKANFLASSRGPGGEYIAIRLSNLREIFDQRIKGDSREDALTDQEANLYGRNQAEMYLYFLDYIEENYPDVILSDEQLDYAMRQFLIKYRPSSLPDNH